MFNQNSAMYLDDFLEAVGFIAPPNYSVDYFVVPTGGQRPPEGGGFERLEQPEDESVTYQRTPPSQKLDTAENPVEYSIWEPEALKRKLATPHPLPRVTDPSELKSPFVKIIQESEEDRLTFILKEDVLPFKKGTLFSCLKRRIR